MAPVMTVSGRTLLKDGVEFKMRGLNYLNDPVNSAEGNSFSNEIAQLTVDAREIRAAGFNVIRVYGQGNLLAGGTVTVAQELAALDVFLANGISVVMNQWVNYDTDYSVATGGTNRTGVINGFASFVTLYKDHAAVIGFAIGNENNYHLTSPAVTEADYYSMIDAAIVAGKAVSSRQFYTCVAGEASTIATTGNAAVTHIDVWSLNVYRGRTFSNLRNTITAGGITKPVFLSEYGYDRYNNRISGEDDYGTAYRVLSLSKEAEAMYPILCGHFLFSWADQWWRTAPNNVHDHGGSAGNDDRDNITDEEWWGICQATPIGNTTSRAKNTAYGLLKDRMSGRLYGASSRDTTYNLGANRQLIRSIGKSLTLNGTSDLATSPLVPGLSGFSFGAWIKIGKTTNSDRILDYSDAGPSGGFNLLVNTTANVSTFTINCYSGASNVASLSSRQVLKEGWYHIVGTIKVNEFKIYLNAFLSASDVSGSMTAPTQTLTIGRRSNGATNFSKMSIAQLIMKNGTVWTQQEITDLYSNGIIPSGSTAVFDFNDQVVDQTGNGNNLTLTGTAYSTNVPIKARSASSSRLSAATRGTAKL